jgi:hypothetical protein
VLIQHEEGAKDIGEVKALKIPSPLANRLVARADRNGGTLLNRDYTIIRRGNGLDTEYDVESEDKAPIDTSKYHGQFADVGAILEQQFNENAPPSPFATPSLAEAAAQNKKLGITGDEVDPRGSRSSTRDALKGAARDANTAVEDDDQPPFEGAPSGASESSPAPAAETAAPGAEDEVELDEGYLRSLHIDTLTTLLDKHGVKIPDSVELTTTAIVDYVVAHYA